MQQNNKLMDPKDKIREYYQEKVKEALDKPQTNEPPSYKERYKKLRESEFFKRIYKNASVGEIIQIKDYGTENNKRNIE